MGNHARPADHSVTTRIRPLPVKSTVRLRPVLDIWHKHAFSAAVTMALVLFTLYGLDRLDLALYVAGGAMCSLYAHGMPYARRARALVWVVLAMVGGMGAGLLSSALIGSPAVLVLLASVLAALHKTVCDATRIGPPGNVILTFIAASAFFVPQRPGEIPAHLGIALLGGAVAWLVCMAPALVRPRGPERIATARALEAAAALLRTDGDDGAARTRHAAAAAVNAAWHTLLAAPGAPAGLRRLLVRAEWALGTQPDAGDAREAAAEAGLCAGWARDLRGGRPVPDVELTPAQAAQLDGIAAENREARRTGEGFRAVLRRLAPGSPLLPIGARVVVGCTLAGWASMALGVGRPYWAVVTAAAIFQINTTVTWQRAVQRTLGNLLGLVLFTALLPVIDTGHVAMILLVLACQIGAEAFISRNYWLGSVCVTPMALLLTEFGSRTAPRELVVDRWTDTLLGAAIGLLCSIVVTNRRASHRIERALRHADEARTAIRELLAPGAPFGTDTARTARDDLSAALVELRDAMDAASGEWWQRALPEERVSRTERQGHRELAQLTCRLHPPVMAA